MNPLSTNAKRVLKYLHDESEHPAQRGPLVTRIALGLDWQTFTRVMGELTDQGLVRQEDGCFTLTVADQVWLRQAEKQPPTSRKLGETQEPIIRAENLHRVFHRGGENIHAINGVSLDIVPGELTAVVGHSGAGKTTLLNLMAGLDEPTEGNVWFRGSSLSNLTPRERLCLRRDNIGFVFQSFGLLPLLSAAENVGIPLRMRGLSPVEREACVQEALAWVGLADRANHRPYELSGGEQQRVAVARALAARPSVILADEPTGQLDSQTGRQITDLLRRLVIERNLTVVIATHDLQVMERANIVYRLVDGRLVGTR